MLTGEGGSLSSLLSESIRCERRLIRRPLAERGIPSPSSCTATVAFHKANLQDGCMHLVSASRALPVTNRVIAHNT